MDFKPIFRYNVRFVVDEERRAVVAMLEASDEDTYEYVAELACANKYRVMMTDYLPQNQFPINRSRGVALCMKGDTFDVETGKKIAYAKLYQKVQASMAKRILRIYERIWNAAQSMYDDIERCDKNMEETPTVDQIIYGDTDEWFKSL